MIDQLKSSAAQAAQEVLARLVERITFHNAENGFCVLRIKARERPESGGISTEAI